MKEMKKPYTLYYKSRYLRAVALLDHLDNHMKEIRDVLFSDSRISEDSFAEKLKEFEIMNNLDSASLKNYSSYETEFEKLILQEKLNHDFLEGDWKPEYY